MPRPARWRPVPGWAAYEVSDRGAARSLPRILANGRPHGGQLLKQRPDRKGYMTVTLSDGRRRRTVRVHILVMAAFAPPPPPGKTQARHLNGNPADNRWPQNLAWGNQADQEEDKARQRRRRELNGKGKTSRKILKQAVPSRALAAVPQVFPAQSPDLGFPRVSAGSHRPCNRPGHRLATGAGRP